MGSERGSPLARHRRWLRVLVIMIVGVGALLAASVLAYIGLSVYDADDPEAADAGIAFLLVSALMVGIVAFGGFKYLRRAR